MKKLIALSLIMFVCVSVGFSQGAGSTGSNITTTITDMEKKVSDAIMNSDWETFGSYMTEDFLSVYSFGVFTRDEELESIRDVTLNDFEMTEVKVTQPAPEVAIITYKVWLDGSHMGNDFSGDYIATSTWIQKDGTWKIVSHAEMESEEMDDDHDMDMDMDSDTDMDMDMDADTVNVSL